MVTYTHRVWARGLSLGLISGGYLALLAGESWLNKDYKTWSAKEANKVMTNSAWSKQAKVNFDPSRMRSGQNGNWGGGGGRGGGGGGGMGGPGGGIGGPGGGGGMGGPGGGMGRPGGGMGGPGEGGGPMPGAGGPPSMNVTVRWESALPVREAALVARYGAEVASQELPSDSNVYRVSVSGMPVNSNVAGGESGGGDNAERFKQMLKAHTSLHRKGKAPIEASDVEMTRGEAGLVLTYSFPKTEEISADDKDLEFMSAMGPMEIKAKFSPKDMMFGGKLAL